MVDLSTVHRIPTRALAEMAVAAALAAVLSLFKLKLPHLLYGGSISLHALPIFVIAIRHGVNRGILVGISYSIVNFALGPFFLHPLQVLLDYPLAFGVLGLAGWTLPYSGTGPWARAALAIGVVLASLARFGMHFVSGIVYFAHLAPEGTAVWRFSLAYNGSYLIPETIINAVVIQILLKPLLGNRSTES